MYEQKCIILVFLTAFLFENMDGAIPDLPPPLLVESGKSFDHSISANEKRLDEQHDSILKHLILFKRHGKNLFDTGDLPAPKVITKGRKIVVEQPEHNENDTILYEFIGVTDNVDIEFHIKGQRSNELLVAGYKTSYVVITYTLNDMGSATTTIALPKGIINIPAPLVIITGRKIVVRPPEYRQDDSISYNFIGITSGAEISFHIKGQRSNELLITDDKTDEVVVSYTLNDIESIESFVKLPLRTRFTLRPPEISSVNKTKAGFLFTLVRQPDVGVMYNIDEGDFKPVAGSQILLKDCGSVVNFRAVNREHEVSSLITTSLDIVYPEIVWLVAKAGLPSGLYVFWRDENVKDYILTAQPTQEQFITKDNHIQLTDCRIKSISIVARNFCHRTSVPFEITLNDGEFKKPMKPNYSLNGRQVRLSSDEYSMPVEGYLIQYEDGRVYKLKGNSLEFELPESGDVTISSIGVCGLKSDSIVIQNRSSRLA